MTRSDIRRLERVTPETLLNDLSTRQHLHPHRPVLQVLGEAQAELGFCLEAGRRAMEWLHLEAGQSVGRLRRGELIQLARSIHRFWRQSLTLETSAG